METSKIKRIVIWGLKKKYHTHRHIHQAFYKNAKKLGYETMWFEDEKKNQGYIEPGDLIITADSIGKMVKEKIKFEDYNLPIRNDIFYCLHNVKDVFKEKLNKKNYINLGVYTDRAEEFSDIKIDEARYFDTKTRTLYQPWGTDLLVHEFKKPVYIKSKFIFWVGSVWNDKLNMGNIQQIEDLKKVLIKKGLKFIKIRFVPDFLNTFLIRISRIAPAIAGKQQVDTNYLPCRMFKNISYGQLGITNVLKFKDLLKNSFIEGKNIEEIIENSLALSKKQYLDIVTKQQKLIENYTYKSSIENIIFFVEKHE